MKPLLDLTDVNYTYQTAEGETPAVKNLSFRVFPDHFLGIIGPSGCGKSTILSLIAGLIQPNSGKIAVSAEIGYMLQKDHLLDWLSIKDNITLGPRIHHKLTPEKESWADKMLEEYGLAPFADARPSQLSGGMRQRAALIRTLALSPSLLLCPPKKEFPHFLPVFFFWMNPFQPSIIRQDLRFPTTFTGFFALST